MMQCLTVFPYNQVQTFLCKDLPSKLVLISLLLLASQFLYVILELQSRPYCQHANSSVAHPQQLTDHRQNDIKHGLAWPERRVIKLDIKAWHLGRRHPIHLCHCHEVTQNTIISTETFKVAWRFCSYVQHVSWSGAFVCFHFVIHLCVLLEMVFSTSSTMHSAHICFIPTLQHHKSTWQEHRILCVLHVFASWSRLIIVFVIPFQSVTMITMYCHFSVVLVILLDGSTSPGQ